MKGFFCKLDYIYDNLFFKLILPLFDMTIKELISKPKDTLILTLWTCDENARQVLADFLSKPNDNDSLFAFDRYTWSELSSGQMPPELMPSSMADFLTISVDSLPPLPKTSFTAIEKTNAFELNPEVSSIADAEADFNDSSYLIFDMNNKLHFLSSAYDFDGVIKGCFYVPKQKILSEMSERFHDKEKIKIDTGIQPRCQEFYYA